MVTGPADVSADQSLAVEVTGVEIVAFSRRLGGVLM
jgi:hypothetical protein